MSASFASASSQRLTAATPLVIAYPFCVGFWAMPTTTGTARTLWSLADTGTTNNYWNLRQTAANQFSLVARAGGTENAASVAGLTAGIWHFWFARFIGDADRSLHIIRGDTGIASAFTTTARTPTGLDTMAMGGLNTSGGASEHFDGFIAEYWLANADVANPVAGALRAEYIYELGFGGPFANPRIRANLVEYRSLRKYPSSEHDELGEVHYGSLGIQTWANTNVVTTGPHPPLPYWYEKPGQYRRVLTI